MRVLGLDYGTTTVGVAMSDATGLIAQEYETITRKQPNKLRKTLARIAEIVEQNQVETVVLGYPLNMNHSEGFRVEDTKEFMALLEKRISVPIILWDERLTTVEAEMILQKSGVRREHRKEVIDQIAAAIILQNYLDANSRE